MARTNARAVALIWLLLVAVGCGGGDEGGPAAGTDPGSATSDPGAGRDPGQAADPGPGASEAKPAALPSLASLKLFSAVSPLNTKIPADAEVDPNSATLVQGLVGSVRCV